MLPLPVALTAPELPLGCAELLRLLLGLLLALAEALSEELWSAEALTAAAEPLMLLLLLGP